MIGGWRSELATKGFAICRGLVDASLVARALAAIENQLTSDLTYADDRQIETWTNRSFVPAIETDNRLLDVYRNSPLAMISQEALTPYDVIPVKRAQVQVRLSSMRVGAKLQPVKDWHCDGIACPHLPPRNLNTFQLLAGVLLSDLPHAYGGAVRFRVGGHHLIADAFRSNTPFAEGRQVPRTIFELPIEEMCGAPGDAIISHHMTPHAVENNQTSADRIMVYFRLRVPDHEKIAWQQLTDPWIRMPRIRTFDEGAR